MKKIFVVLKFSKLGCCGCGWWCMSDTYACNDDNDDIIVVSNENGDNTVAINEDDDHIIVVSNENYHIVECNDDNHNIIIVSNENNDIIVACNDDNNIIVVSNGNNEIVLVTDDDNDIDSYYIEKDSNNWGNGEMMRIIIIVTVVMNLITIMIVLMISSLLMIVPVMVLMKTITTTKNSIEVNDTDNNNIYKENNIKNGFVNINIIFVFMVALMRTYSYIVINISNIILKCLYSK